MKAQKVELYKKNYLIKYKNNENKSNYSSTTTDTTKSTTSIDTTLNSAIASIDLYLIPDLDSITSVKLFQFFSSLKSTVT